MSTFEKDYKAIVAKLPPNVRVPMLYTRQSSKINSKSTSCKYTVSSLMLVFFAKNLGRVMTKAELLDFLHSYGCNSNDPQPRHMGMQWGLHFLIQGSYHPYARRVLKQGEYSLIALKKPPLPTASCHRSIHISASRFEDIVKIYHNRCAVCGSERNKPHLKNPRVRTHLQRGHCDPKKPLDIKTNCIPICMVCNQVYKNKAIFTKSGFIKEII